MSDDERDRPRWGERVPSEPAEPGAGTGSAAGAGAGADAGAGAGAAGASASAGSPLDQPPAPRYGDRGQYDGQGQYGERTQYEHPGSAAPQQPVDPNQGGWGQPAQPQYGAGQYGQQQYGQPQYGQGFVPGKGRPVGKRTVGVIALIAGVIALVIGVVAGLLLGSAIANIPELLRLAQDGTADSTSIDDAIRAHPAAVEQVGLAGVMAALGSAFGLWAIIQGIVAIVQRRGRGLGVAAIVTAVLGVVAFGVLYTSIAFSAIH